MHTGKKCLLHFHALPNVLYCRYANIVLGLLASMQFESIPRDI